MKKVINGKLYNTDGSTLIGSWDNGLGTSDFNCCEEALFKSPKGQFFLHGQGHGLTRWASRHGNASGWGEDIVLLTEAEALEWAERHLSADDIAWAFKVEEG